MTIEKAQELRNMLENHPPEMLTYTIGRIVLQIALELDRIAETQEEAHK